MHCADYNTAPSHWRNAAIAVTNDRYPLSQRLLENSVFHEDTRQSFVESWRRHKIFFAVIMCIIVRCLIIQQIAKHWYIIKVTWLISTQLKVKVKARTGHFYVNTLSFYLMWRDHCNTVKINGFLLLCSLVYSLFKKENWTQNHSLSWLMRIISSVNAQSTQVIIQKIQLAPPTFPEFYVMQQEWEWSHKINV